MGPIELRQDSLRDAVRAAGIAAPPIFHERLDSTSTEALRLAEEGAPEWTVVATNHQVAGRGRLGRTWSTPPGRALTFSMVLRPALGPERAPLVALLAATSMASACAEVAGVDIRAEWPNDLLIEGRKVAGILPESAIAGGHLLHLVLGIGLNVSMQEEDFPEEIRGSATSVALAGGRPVGPAAILGAYLRLFRDAYEADGFPAGVVDSYAARCATLGRRVRATTLTGAEVEGTAVAVDDDGSLVVERDGHRHVVAFGEVERLD